jgi:hypothetical protein
LRHEGEEGKAEGRKPALPPAWCKLCGAVNKQYKQAESNRDLGKFLRYALGRTVNTSRSKPPVLVETTPEGTRVGGGKKKVEAFEKKYTEEHFGKGHKHWYMDYRGGAMLPEFKSNSFRRQWRERLAAGRLSSDEWNIIPEQLHGVHMCAQRVSDKAGNVAGPQHTTVIFSQAPSQQAG